MIIVNAENLILGRMATFVAKQALLGQEVRVINADKAIISGTKAKTIEDAKHERNRGTPAKGPFITKMPDRYVRRVIRGMLPYKITKGAEAYKRILCYSGIPEEFKDSTAVEIKGANFEKLPNLKYTTVGEVLKNV